MKNAFHFIWKALFVLDFCISFLPSFFTCWPLLQRMIFKINLKVNDAINCLNKSTKTNFVWYLEKKKSYDIETLSIDGVSDKERFYRKAMQTLETLAYVNHRMPFFPQLNPPSHFGWGSAKFPRYNKVSKTLLSLYAINYTVSKTLNKSIEIQWRNLTFWALAQSGEWNRTFWDFIHPRENQLARRFFVKFNLLLFFLIS